MAGHDEDHIERGVLQDSICAGGSGAEGEALLRVDRGQRAVGRDMGEPDRGIAGQMRQQHRGGVAAGADEPDRQPALGGPRRRGLAAGQQPAGRGRLGAGLRLGYSQQHAHGLQRAGGQVVVGGGRLLDRERRADQGLDLDVLAGEQVEEAFQVAPLGPAHVPGRVVDAVQLVAGVIPARAVGPGEPDVELLVVVRVPGQVQPGLADVHHPGPVPGQLRRRSRPGRWSARPRSSARGRRRGRRSARPAPAPRRPGPRRRARRSAPHRPARPGWQRSAFRSRPTTRTPAAISSRTASWPTRPRPMTQAVSPSWTSACRTPCMAMAPTVAKAACSGATSRGTGTHMLTGIQLYSACRAYSLPAAATSWPTWNSAAPLPTSVTTPHSE